jgi:hypothetical protein
MINAIFYFLNLSILGILNKKFADVGHVTSSIHFNVIFIYTPTTKIKIKKSDHAVGLGIRDLK